MFKPKYLYLLLCILALTKMSAQDDSTNPYITYDVASQNLLKFNRFLINPTFSTVREDKSYINLLHRNQSATFDDNNQTYFLSYSGRMNDRTGLGLSIYSQQLGTLSNYGVLANYAYGLKLSDKSNFTFGANFSYYRSGFDESRSTTVDADDPLLSGLQDSNLISFQPGFNLSYGKFDFGVFAENLFDYNLKTSESITEFGDKTYAAHLQYTHELDASSTNSILDGGRLMPLLRVRKAGAKYESLDDDIILGGSLILDLPKLGWVQGGYDSYYGAAAGLGINLNKRISIGYTMEKGLSNSFDNFGVTHEISFAYSITPNLTEDRVMLEDTEELADNSDLFEEPEPITEKDIEIENLKNALAENNEIVAEMMYRQDSIEASRNRDLEQRFDMVMRMVRRETNGENPDLEERAKQMYLLNNLKDDDGTELVSNNPLNNNVKNATSNEVKTNKPVYNGVNYNDQNGSQLVSNTSDTEKPIVKNAASNEDKTNKPVYNSVNYDDQNDSQLVSNTTHTEKTTVKDLLEDPKKTISNKQSIDTRENTVQPEKKVDAFTKIAKNSNVKTRKFKNLDGVNEGYYVVANVYKNEHYMNNFINELEENGIEADYFENKNNGLKYVYLKRSDSWEDALSSYESRMDDNYDAAMWIMNVDNSTYSDTAYASNSVKIKEKSSKYNTDRLKTNTITKDNVASSSQPVIKNYNLRGIGNGYYIIANVFASARNANNFVKLLNSQGLNASYFINPENNYRYVYLKKHGDWNNALISYYSKINNAYDQRMWIMKVTPGQIT
ncbi:type IX secretion system membrane protein PorP/SprF [Cellulophaga baltica]|uniref:PorP/SprF family type IX secretion system membrane protein n=1 Tax=Cellulophaga TaxID=104264 RepID=UPI001C075964|nr:MULTISPECIES: type IX secretion system membrane protein PorP/SprF [Cellulophaga]MBU2995900.1 type IX secretion system membrane protein PorP/SprF [Cellulophaga baltica]MDO6767295.1 type IX secretion system membrane protein PorP/SprF [Cellulophaga sp. 1_MG-2023]